MSAAAAEPIRTAADLDLPANLTSLGEGFPLKARAQLADDLLGALDAARQTGDLTKLQATVRRWQFIRQMVMDPSWPETVQRVSSEAWRNETPMTLEEFHARFPQTA